MDGERAPNSCDGPAFLEHLTGTSRDAVTWLSESALDLTVSRSQQVRVTETTAGEAGPDVVARLHRSGDTYEVEALNEAKLWINGRSETSKLLDDGDTIEFGENGPITRLFLCREDRSIRQTVAAVLEDAVAYARTSRRPVVPRIAHAMADALRRLCLLYTSPSPRD